MSSEAEIDKALPTPHNLSRKGYLSGNSDEVHSLKPHRSESHEVEQATTFNQTANLTSRADLPVTSSSLEFNSAEDEERLDRIRSAMAYTRAQLASGSQPTVVDYFNLTPVSPTEALMLLRHAYHNGVASLISCSPAHETYSIGIPPGPASKGFGNLNPQWWVGLSRADMKAGPFSDEADVRKAEGDVKAMLKRRKKSEKCGRLHIEKKIIAEGLRKQKKELIMWDEEEWGREAREERGGKERRRGGTDNMKQGIQTGTEEVNKEEQTQKRKTQKYGSQQPASIRGTRPVRSVRFVGDSDEEHLI